MQQFLTKTIMILGQITGVVYVLLLLKQFYRIDTQMFIIPFHVFTTLALVFLFIPMEKKDKRKIWTMLFDLFCYGVCIFLVVYYWMNVDRTQIRFEMIDPVFIGERIAFWVGIPLILEGIRRTSGWSLVLVVLSFLVYGFGFVKLPGILYFSGFKISDYVEITMLGTEGVFGVASTAMVTMVFFFILFGSFFEATGGGDMFMDISLLIFGKYKGGAAKTSVISSGLFGMISGSAVANVTTTGVITIPLMRRTGYSAEQAAATEAVASTGGQIMPPVMGIAAFVMAEILGIPYSKIASAAIIPALGYYTVVFVSVDLLARKLNIGSVENVLLKQKTQPFMPRIHLLLGPIAMIICLFLGYSVPFAALMATMTTAIAPLIRKNTWYPIKSIYSIIISTAKQMAKISVSVSGIGIIIALCIQTGLAIRFVNMLAIIGEGNLTLSLFLVILGVIILGMGMPTIAAYVIGAVIFVPALTKFGIEPLAAHFFVFYYSVLSMITPPVCLATFAAAALADSKVNKTGYLAFIMGLSAFFIPFGFVYDMTLLGRGSIGNILMASFGVLCASCSWAIAVQGWLGKNLNLFERAVFGILCIIIVFKPTLSFAWWVGNIVFILLSLYYLLPSLQSKNNTIKTTGNT